MLICDIEEGEDLQYDIQSRVKAATLLGILLDAAQQPSEEQDDVRMKKFRTFERVFMKRSNAISTNQQRRLSIREIKYDKTFYQKVKVKMKKALAYKKCYEKRIKDNVNYEVKNFTWATY